MGSVTRLVRLYSHFFDLESDGRLRGIEEYASPELTKSKLKEAEVLPRLHCMLHEEGERAEFLIDMLMEALSRHLGLPTSEQAALVIDTFAISPEQRLFDFVPDHKPILRKAEEASGKSAKAMAKASSASNTAIH